MVYLTLHGKLWIKVDVDDIGILNDVKDRFSFYIDGYYFSPKYRAGSWDGRISLFKAKNRTIPYGLLFDLISFLKEKNYDVKASDEVKQLYGNKENLNIKYDLKYEPRDYQRDAIESCLKYKKSLFKLPTASGKSLCITYILKTLFNNNKIKKALLIVPTTSLIIQFFDDMIDYGMDKNLLGKFYADEKDWDKPILISTWQVLAYNNEKLRKNEISRLSKEVRKKSIKAEDKKKHMDRLVKIKSQDYIDNVKQIMAKRKGLLESVDCVFGDEVQLFKSTEISSLMQKIHNAEWRFGCTGTLPDDDIDLGNIKSFLGPITTSYSVKDLTGAGYLNECVIHVYNISYNTKIIGKLNEIKDQLFENEFRQGILNSVVEQYQDTNMLFLVNRIDNEGKLLETQLKEQFPDHQIKFIYSKVKISEREEWRQKCINEKKVILVANYSLFQQGINIPGLSLVILASSFKGKIRILQSIGRSLRTNEGKQKSIIIDIADNVKYIKKHKKERLKLYNKEEFEIKEFDIRE